MTEQIRRALLAQWHDCPEDYRSQPASEEELSSFEAEYGLIPAAFREYLAVCGGGIGGSPEWIDGLAELGSTHRHYRTGVSEGWFTMRDVFVIGWDGGGNPFGIERSSGRVLVEDHDFGGIHEMAPSFSELLLQGLRRHIRTEN